MANETIIIDEEAFDTAISEFNELSNKLKKLRDEVESMMDVLKDGFNTPAGVKFINACEANLYKPLNEQKLVIDHISATLKESKQAYQSVFNEYDLLQAEINKAND
jgi:uncharacterized protein YukE